MVGRRDGGLNTTKGGSSPERGRLNHIKIGGFSFDGGLKPPWSPWLRYGRLDYCLLTF